MIKGRLTEVSRNHVSGWAVDTKDPERPLLVRIEVNGTQVAKIQTLPPTPKADDSVGALPRRMFKHTFAPPLPVGAGHHLRVLTGKAQRALPNGEVDIPALSPESVEEQLGGIDVRGITGLFVTAMPRSGTTLMMQKLAAHPQILAASHTIYEHPMASYLADLARISVAPAFPNQPVGLNAHFREKHSIGPNPYYAPRFRRAFPSTDAMDHFHQVLMPNRMYDAARRTLEDFYAMVALQNGKTAPRYFAEKLETAPLTRGSIRAMLPDAREILLVRDPRDLYAWYKARYPDINKLSVRQVRLETSQVLAAAQEHSPNVTVLRYEDLLGSEQASLDHLFAFLGLPPLGQRDDKAEQALFSRHGTSQSPKSSIGRWRSSLTAEEQAQCNEQLAPFLAFFGYDPG